MPGLTKLLRTFDVDKYWRMRKINFLSRRYYKYHRILKWDIDHRRYRQKPINVTPNSIKKKKSTIKHVTARLRIFDRLSKLGQNEVTQSLERKRILKQIAFAFSYSRIEAVGISNLLFKWETCNIFRPGGRHGSLSLSFSLSFSLFENPT